MSAELSYRTDGVAEMVYVGETPWHKEGVKLPDGCSWEEARELSWGYEVEKCPYYLPTVGANGKVEYQPATDAFYTRRADTGAVLGTVGAQYEVVQNDDAFAVLKPLVEEGVLRIETAGALRDGADCWLLGRWDLERFGPEAKAVLGGEVVPFSTVMANHSGRRGILMGNTPIRIVCANTLGMAERDAESSKSLGRWLTVRHTAGARVRLVDAARELFAGVVDRYERIARQYRTLQSVWLSEDQFKALVLDVVAPDPRLDPDFNPESKLAGLVLDRADRKRAELRRLWYAGKGHTGEPTAWYAYNAVAEALDHNKDLWPTRGGAWRTASLLGGHLGELNDRVLDGLMAAAAAA